MKLAGWSGRATSVTNVANLMLARSTPWQTGLTVSAEKAARHTKFLPAGGVKRPWRSESAPTRAIFSVNNVPPVH
jgi:hypothetical protein